MIIHTARVLVLILISFISFKSAAQYKFQISGQIKNIADKPSKFDLKHGDTVFLNFINLKRHDTAIINHNEFKFEGEVPYPSVAMVDYKYGGALILIDNSLYSVALINIMTDSIHREYDPVIKTESPFFNARKRFNTAVSNLYAQKNNYENALAKTTNQDTVLYYNTQVKEIDKKLSTSYRALANDKTNNYVTAYVAPAAPDFSYDGYIGIYNSLPDSVKDTFYGRNFRNKLTAAKNLQPADKPDDYQVVENGIPPILGVDTLFNKVTLDKAFYKKNKYTIIEFWASWCAPCRDINRDLRKEAAGLSKRGIGLIGFSLDKTLGPWQTAIKNDKLSWLQISDFKATDSPVSRYLKLTYIPYNIIVDSEGRIVKSHIYGAELESFLKSVN